MRWMEILLATLLLNRFVNGGLGPPSGNIHQTLFGSPCECKGGHLSKAPTSYTQTMNCTTKVAYFRAETNQNTGGFHRPEWVCVNKPKLATTKTPQNCSVACTYTQAMHISCYAIASICFNNQGKQHFQAILTRIRSAGGTTTHMTPGLFGQGGIRSQLQLAGCEGSIGKPSCWPVTAPTGVSDGGGPMDAVKHLQIIELLKPQIP
jgi:hypothetical protein